MYYLVKGQNGIVIKEGYGKALGAQKYLIKPTMKKYEVFEEAEAAALEHLTDIVPYYIPLPANIDWTNSSPGISSTARTRSPAVECPPCVSGMRSPAGLRNPERQRTLTSTLSFRVMYPEP